MSDTNEMPWGDAPDVEWSCVVEQGRAMLVIQTTGPLLSAGFLERECKTIELRFIFDETKLPEFVPKHFVCFADKDWAHPLLVADPNDRLLMPLRKAITKKEPWVVCLQFVIEGERKMRMFWVQPEPIWTAEPLAHPEDGEIWNQWLVGIGG